MLFFAFIVVLCVFSSGVSAAWFMAGEQVDTVLGVSVGASNSSEIYSVGYDGANGFVYYSYDRGNAASSKKIQTGPTAVHTDIALNDGKLCIVGANSIYYGEAKGVDSTFTRSETFTHVVSHSIEKLGTSNFAAVGRFDETNGVAVSTDAGVTWTASDLGANANDGHNARYGAFPSPSTWYITAGTWPNDADARVTNGNVARISARLSVYYNTGNGAPQTSFISARNLQGTYPGAVYKTVDAGSTFTQVFNSNGDFYLNQIDCIDTNHCVAVGENAKKAVIIKTTDGGSTWTTTLTLNGPYSLHAVKMLSSTKVAVAGGAPSVGPYASKEWVGYYYESNDGGDNWTLGPLMNGYGYDLTFWDANRGYSVALFKKHSYLWIYA